LIREAFLSFVELREINRRKAALLAKAQWWFGTALILLLIMAALPVLVEPIDGLLACLWRTLGGWTIAVFLGVLVAVEIVDRIVTAGRSAKQS